VPGVGPLTNKCHVMVVGLVVTVCCCGMADKSLIVWRLTRDESSYGVPQKSLHGHGHFVSDVILSSDGQFALSGSWDHTLRLWDLSRYILHGLQLSYTIHLILKVASTYKYLLVYDMTDDDKPDLYDVTMI